MPGRERSLKLRRSNAAAGALLLILSLVGHLEAVSLEETGHLLRVQGATDEVLARVERVVNQGERAEAGQRTQISPRQLTDELARANADLDAYLKARPDDVRALILFARLGRLQEIAKPQVFGRGAGQLSATPDKDEPAHLHRALDRALALEPNNGEAHYWKARLYGVRTAIAVEGRFYMVPRDLDRAIQFASRAVELAPESVPYREALVVYLVGAQKYKDAMEVMRNVAGGQHPFYVLISDLEALPIPDSAVFLPTDTENIARMELESGRIRDFANLRVRMYAVPLRSAEIEAFYRGRWPKFQLFEPDKGPQERNMSISFQYLRMRNDVLEPALTRAEVEPAISGTPRDGVVIGVFELRNLPPDKRTSPAGQRLPSGFGDNFSFIIVRNLRPVASQ